MAWIYLFLAGLFEVAWAIGLNTTKAFRGSPLQQRYSATAREAATMTPQ
jgi:multidrug transporter EmrE-like cation transporter